MVVKFGTYNLEFDDTLADLFEKHVYDTIQESAWIYVNARTGIEDENKACKKYTAEEIKGFILSGVKEELNLCGVKIDV